MRRITNDQAKRFALAAQGFNDGRPSGRIDRRHFRKVLDRVRLIQIDSVNYFSRAHFMPFFSRLGPYNRDRLDDWLWRSGEVFEYWGHEASLLPVDHHRLFRWQMEGDVHWKAMERLKEKAPDYIEEVYSQVVEGGPIQTADLEDTGKRPGRSMWNWNTGKLALEVLFMQGRVTTAERPRNFVRLYDIPERVLPRSALEAPTPEKDVAQSELLLEAVKAMGVATAEDIGDYYRIRMPATRPLVAKLAETGQIIEVEVEGWDKPGYLHPDAALPRKKRGTALLSPFDNLVWCRPRIERIWDFHYRIEIYVPEAKRVYGYYVLPFLLDGELVARVDLKSDRQMSTLRVKGAFAEPGVDRAHVGAALAEEVRTIANWLEMDEVAVDNNGDLSAELRKRV